MTAPPPVDVVLRDGSTARVRVAGPADAPLVRDLLERLEPEARWFRFFSGGVNVERAAAQAVAPQDGLALLVVTGAPERAVGHALYERTAPDVAEVAFAVDGPWQGRGLATTLLAHLASAAADDGIAVFEALTLAGNHRMIGVFRASGFPVDVRSGAGELQVRFPTSPTPEGRRRFEARERDAAVAAVAPVLRPAAVLVAGADGAVGAAVLANLERAGYRGAVHAVAGGAVAQAPGPIDLAVLALPAAGALEAARACAARGDVRALAVLRCGGAPADAAALVAVCRAGGMRLIGPDSLGVLNADPDVRLDATFAPDPPPPGRTAFAAQSGAFGIAALDLATQRGVGIASFVSMGAKADLSGNDLLQFWEADANAEAVLLHLESFGNPRRFASVARRLAAAKPLIAVKSGRAAGGPPRRDASRTGALLAAADTYVDALFRHAGVIRTDTLAEMFDLAALLERQPVPRGDRVAIVTNAGGLGVQCADACAAAGLRVQPLGEPAQRALLAALPVGAAAVNPVDVSAGAAPHDYAIALAHVADDPGVDAIIVLFARSPGTDASAVAAVLDAPARRSQTALAVFMGADAPPLAAPGGGVPRFAAPEEAVRALRRALDHGRRLARPPDALPALGDVDADRAAAIVAAGLARGGGWLAPTQVEGLLKCYGLPTATSRVATSARGAVRAAARIGGEVAVKALAPGLMRKAETGAVRTGVSGPTAVQRAAREVLAAAREHGFVPDGVLVQRMAPAGSELLAGVAADPSFGPLVVLAAGGATAELLGDVEARLAPVGPREADTMIAGLRTYPLLDGFRGRPRADLGALRDVLLRIGALAAQHPAIAELDCDPLIAGPAGVTIVDARVRLEPPPPERPYAALGVGAQMPRTSGTNSTATTPNSASSGRPSSQQSPKR
jgi:acyl-CoA synthetase (NDP forming)/GNAT superfamily N-acetyltransferase